MAKTPICCIEGCGKPVLNKPRQLCSRHYQRWQRHGDPLGGKAYRERLPEFCTIDGCKNAASASGMCSMHYARTRKHGSPHVGAFVHGGTCTIDGCGKPLASQGLCDAHLARKRRHGDPLYGGAVKKKATVGEPLAWLKRHASFSGNECLYWPYSRDSSGYGGVLFRGKDNRAHRVMCELAHGKPPHGAQACHSCGNGHLGCVNPKHLRWGSVSENHSDKVLHGTDARGEKAWNAKLTADRVRYIRKSGLSVNELAKKFGVSPRTISSALRRISWGWLD